MKKTLLKTFATLLIGMAIGASTLAAAAPQTVQGVLTKFNIVVNGEKQELKNTPVVIQGSTYLPVREVAGLLDADLTFDSKSQKIELNTKGETKVTETAQATEWVSLRDLHEKYSVNISIGPLSDQTKYGITIKKGQLKIEVPDVKSFPNGTIQDLKTLDGKEIKVKSLDSTTYLSIESLTELGVIE